MIRKLFVKWFGGSNPPTTNVRIIRPVVNEHEERLIAIEEKLGMNKIFTSENLEDEYSKWVSMCGQRRNSNDIRFGQHIFNLYRYEVGNSYNEELPRVCYEIIKSKLLEESK